MLREVYNKPILFSAKQVRYTQAIFAEKEAKEKAEQVRINAKKAATALKKHIEAIQAQEKALQQLARESNQEEFAAEERAK